MNKGGPIIPGRPLVVLAGWLGCQPRSLRRYENLYRNLGFQVITRIPTPTMVVEASRRTLSFKLHNTSSNENMRLETMNHLAWSVLRHVQASQCSLYVYHGFSNGGAFLWEQIRRILFASTTSLDTLDAQVQKDIKELRDSLLGIVFDSSPAYYSPTDHDNLGQALSYCPWWERARFYVSTFIDYATKNQKDIVRQRERRATEFWQGLKRDASNTHQLYLYSRDDELTPCEPLTELVGYRQSLFGCDRIFSRQWESSPHCCHLLKHPVEYETALLAFLELCVSGPRYRMSRL